MSATIDSNPASHISFGPSYNARVLTGTPSPLRHLFPGISVAFFGSLFSLDRNDEKEATLPWIAMLLLVFFSGHYNTLTHEEG